MHLHVSNGTGLSADIGIGINISTVQYKRTSNSDGHHCQNSIASSRARATPGKAKYSFDLVLYIHRFEDWDDKWTCKASEAKRRRDR